MPLPSPDPALDDGVVRLRELRDADVPAIVEACRDPEVVRWTVVPAPYRESDARAYVTAAPIERAEGRGLHLAFVDAGDERLLGSLSLRLDGGTARVGEIGYWTHPEGRGRGLTRRAVRLLCDWAPAALRLGALTAWTEPENHRSQRLLAHVGFVETRATRRHSIRGREVRVHGWTLPLGEPLKRHAHGEGSALSTTPSPDR